MTRLFTAADRDRIRDRVLRMASSDPRVAAGAVIGSLAEGVGDTWSDLDLTFAVVDGVPVLEVLDDWTRSLVAEDNAVQLFDVPSGASLYRVFLMPGCLQFDLSFTPASRFGARGPKFRLLFGEAVDLPFAGPPDARDLFGQAVHHALRARFCVERSRHWQAEYWISSLRDSGLSLACRRRGLPAHYARGYDELPGEVLARFQPALVRSLEKDELLRALSHAVTGLLEEADEVRELAAQVEPELRRLIAAWD